MQGTVFSLLAIAAAVSADTTLTTTATAATDTSLPSLVAEIPACANDCLQTTATALGCAAADLSCFCSGGKRGMNIASAAVSFAECLLMSTCNSSETSQLEDLAPRICRAALSAPASALSVASQEVTAALGTSAASLVSATATTTGAKATSSAVKNGTAGKSAAADRAVMAIMGVGSLAVLAACVAW